MHDENKNMIKEENKKLAFHIMKQLSKKIDAEAFLNIFKDKYNWFASLGVTEEDYQNIAAKVNKYRDVIEKEFNEQNDIVTVNKVVYLEGEGYYKGFRQIIGTKPPLKIMSYYRRINTMYEDHDDLADYILNKKISDSFEYIEEQYQVQNIWTLGDFFNLLMMKDKRKQNNLKINDGDVIIGKLINSNDFYNFFQHFEDDEDETKLIDGIDSYLYSNIEEKEDGLYISGVLDHYKIENVITPETFLERFNIKKEKQKVLTR